MTVLKIEPCSITAVLLVTLLALTSPVRGAEPCDAFSANGVDNWYPFVYRTANNRLTGSIADGTRAALNRIGLKMNVQQNQPWKRIMHDLEEGQLDIVLGAYWNAERAAKYVYSEPLGTDEVRVFVKAGNEFSLSALDDLIGRAGLKLLGGSYGDAFDKYAASHLDFTKVPESDRIVKMLAHGRADYGILGYIEGLQHIRNQGVEGQVVALQWPILSNAMYVMINKRAACANRIKELNAAIKAMQNEGVLEKIFSRHVRHGPDAN